MSYTRNRSQLCNSGFSQHTPNSLPIYMATSCGTSSLRSQHLIHIVTGMPHAMYSILAMLCWEPDAFNSAKMSEAYMHR